MAHSTLESAAPNLPLPPGMQLVLEAVDPTADGYVAGVTVTKWMIYGYDASPQPLGDLFSVNPLLVPTQGTV